MGINMNQFFKNTALVFLFVLVSCKVFAQKLTTHAVKKGETLESIAKHYKVTPYSILSFNKEIKKGEGVKPNTILVIPLDAKASDISTNSTKVVEKVEKAEDQEKPIGFTSHKVKKRETLFGIAKRYRITEDDIKRYNKELYAQQLKKGMRLKIPKYRRVEKKEVVINEADFETYTVSPSETRWSIAHKFEITLDSLLVLNPELSKSTDYLAEGQSLRVPKRGGVVIEEPNYVSYKVPAKETFYNMEKNFGVKADELMKLNPEIKERGGLKEGMVLRIPQKKKDPEAVNTENFIFYEVKPKQTEFSLTRKFNISWTELVTLNPKLIGGLKAGMVLKLPKNQTGDFEVRNALIVDKINLIDSINVVNKPKLLFMLPFRLDKLNIKDRKTVAKTIQNRSSLKVSLGLYSGALVALDSIKKLGVSVDVKTLDNQLNINTTRQILTEESLAGYNAIIGPLDAVSLKEVATKARMYDVPVLAPAPAKINEQIPNLYYTYSSEEVLRDRLLNYVEENRTNQNIVVIADAKNEVVKKQILEKFPEAKIVTLKEEKKNVAINIDGLTRLLSEDVENWVFLETGNFKIISSVSSILNSSINEEVMVKMFTTNKNKAFDNDVISNSHLSNLRFTYPSVYKEMSSNSFTRMYKKRFGENPDRYATRGFDITYDVLLKLAYKNNLKAVSKEIGVTEYTANKFDYESTEAGVVNQASYIMCFQDMSIKELTGEETKDETKK